MAIDVGEVVATLRANTKQFEQAMGTSKTSMLALGAGSVAMGNIASQAFNAVLSGATSAASAIVRWAGEASAAAERTRNLSMALGIADRTLEAWGMAATHAGGSVDTLAGGMRTLSRHLEGLGSGSEESVEIFNKLGTGMTVVDMAGMDTEQTIRLVADRFANMSDGAEKSKLAIDLFGRSGLQLLPILNQGSAGLDRAAREAERFGVVLSDSQRASLDQYDTAVDKMSSALEGFKNQVAAAFAPSLTKNVEWMTSAVSYAKSIFTGFADAAEKLFVRFGAMSAAIQLMGQQLFSMSVFNKEAWLQTLDQVKAIDSWAAAELKAIDIGKNAEVQMDANIKKTKEYTVSQKALGEAIMQGTQIQVKLHQEAKEAAMARMAGEMEIGARKVAFQQDAKQAVMDQIAAEMELGQRQEAFAADRNKLFGIEVEQAEKSRVLALQLSKPPDSGPFVEAIERKEAAVRNLLNIMPELSREEAIALAARNDASATRIVYDSTEAWRHRNDTLIQGVSYARTLDEAQRTMFGTELNMFGASTEARHFGMNLLEAEGALKRQLISEEIASEDEKAGKLLQLEIELDSKRRQVIRQYPSFFEQQMQAIVQSNSFSIGQISTTWTSGLANAAVNGGNFVEQAWKSTQVAVLQGLLNFGIQKMAQLALLASMELGLISATNAAALGLNTAKNAAIVVGDSATAATTVGIWAGAGAAITGTFGAMTAAIMGFFTATIIPFFASIGTMLMTFLSAIAAAASATIFGIPYGVAILAGVALIGAAVGSLMAFGAFAEGGVVTKPMMGLVGEAGPEAIIPLSKLDQMSGGGQQTIIVELDGRQLAKSVFDNMSSVTHMRMGRA